MAMRKVVTIDGREYPLLFNLVAQEEVLERLGMNGFVDFADEEKTSEIVSRPTKLGKVAYVGCKWGARRESIAFDYSEEEFIESVSNIAEMMGAFEQLMADLGFSAAAAPKGGSRAKK